MPYDEKKTDMDTSGDYDYSLESILAEYKGSAFIKGQSRMAKDELEREAARIIEEYTGIKQSKSESIATAEEKSAELTETVKRTETMTAGSAKAEVPQVKGEKKPHRGDVVKKSRPAPEPVEDGEKTAKRGIVRGLREVEEKLQRVSEVEERQAKRFSYRELSDDEQEFFGVGKYSRTKPEEKDGEVERAMAGELHRRERKKRAKPAPRSEKASPAPPEEQEAGKKHRELPPTDAVRVYGSGLESIRLRMLPMLAICIVMAYVTYAGEAGFILPDFLQNIFGRNLFLAAGLLVSSMLGAEVFIRGIADTFSGRFGAETLVSASCIFALLDAVLPLFVKSMDHGTPFCTVAACSLLFSMWGVLKGRKAYNLSFKIAANTSVPTVVSSEWEKVDEGAVITKGIGSSHGFVDKSVERDVSEAVYSRAAPILILLSIVLAALCAFRAGEKSAFVHCLAGFGAVAASFNALMIFNQPFFIAAKNLFDHGAAIAGWSGACDMKRAVGMVVRDTDIFPENKITLNGLKIMSKMPEERIIAYTGSLVVASGMGTARIFAGLMREYSCSLYRVDEFSCYESGGIGATVDGCRVLVGSSAFMTLMGIKLPVNLEIKNAVFSAVNDELAGIFIINYMPADTVQNALTSMAQAKITPVFAIRDFNITPALIKSKFKVSIDNGAFTTFAARYELSQSSDTQTETPSALMSREGINHYTEIVRSGRRIVNISHISLLLSLLSTLAGMVLMILTFSRGGFASASAAHTLTYMLMWGIAEYLIATF